MTDHERVAGATASATVAIASGALSYRVTGPTESTEPPVVFVHGFLVDSRLWDGVAERLAAAGIRSYLVDWPLGSHRTPMEDDADLSATGVARLIGDTIAALGLDGVTLVGNDTGGGLCQLLVAERPERIGRLVLTNCDAFEAFPPAFFVPLFIAARSAIVTRLLLAPMAIPAMRHSPLAYGMLLGKPRDSALTRAWLAPARTDRRIRRDIARFARALDRRALVTAAPRLAGFAGPVSIVWGTRDRCFTLAMGRRLVAAFGRAELTEVAGVSTFVPVDAPDAVAGAIEAISRQPART